MFDDTINKRLEWLNREDDKNKMELRRLGSDIRSSNDKLNRLLSHLNLEDKWLGMQIVEKK